MAANPWRGEAELALGIGTFVLRPSFGALTAAETEIGPLFTLVERAANGRMTLAEMVALFWHCLHPTPADVTRDAFAEAVATAGLSHVTPALKRLIGQILQGR